MKNCLGSLWQRKWEFICFPGCDILATRHLQMIPEYIRRCWQQKSKPKGRQKHCQMSRIRQMTQPAFEAVESGSVLKMPTAETSLGEVGCPCPSLFYIFGGTVKGPRPIFKRQIGSGGVQLDWLHRIDTAFRYDKRTSCPLCSFCKSTQHSISNRPSIPSIVPNTQHIHSNINIINIKHMYTVITPI